MLPFGSAHELDELLEEFIDFQLLSDDDIPSTIWEIARITPDDGTHAKKLELCRAHTPRAHCAICRIAFVCMSIIL